MSEGPRFGVRLMVGNLTSNRGVVMDFLIGTVLAATAIGLWRSTSLKGMTMADPNLAEQRDLLERNDGPHEVGGILRMHRNGFPATAIGRKLGKTQPQVIKELQDAINAETDAHHSFRLIHGGDAPKQSK